MQKFTPFLKFGGKAKQASSFHLSVFKQPGLVSTSYRIADKSGVSQQLSLC